jgi:LAS superfamily LD-carboxypeptidase LdcB
MEVGQSQVSRLWPWLAAGAALLFVGGLGGGRPREEDEGEGAMPSTDRPPFPAIEVSPGLWLATDAAHAFIMMRHAARDEAGLDLSISTAWRSREYQQRLYDAWVAYKVGKGPWAPMAAKPGSSLHEKGIAVDLHGLNSAKPNYNPVRTGWLKANAERFDYFNTGAFFSTPEPWHWVFGVRREGFIA